MRNVYSNYMDLVSTTIVFVFPKKRLATFTYSVSSTQIILVDIIQPIKLKAP